MVRREPAATVASGVQGIITSMVLQAYCLTRGEASPGRNVSVQLTAASLVAKRRTYYHEAVGAVLRCQPGKEA